jgi:transposase
MSKAPLVITAVVTGGRSQGEAARAYGVSQGWVSRLVARYRAEGEAAFEPRSRRPKTSPNAIGDATAGRIITLRKELTGQGLDAGPDTICWHLQHHHQVSVAPATVSRYLARAGLVAPEPRKRPRSSYIRFAAEQPSECWQSDFTRYPLADGTGTEILTWLDDHSRYALRVTAHPAVTGPILLAAQPRQPATTGQLQAMLEIFTGSCNQQRPHRSLPHRATPAAAYHARPKAVPGGRGAGTHHRVRADRVDADGKLTLRHGGRLYHIGTGRIHARTRVLMLVRDLDIRVINAATGELLRALTLDPSRNYQPTGRPPGPPPRTPRQPRHPEP